MVAVPEDFLEERRNLQNFTLLYVFLYSYQILRPKIHSDHRRGHPFFLDKAFAISLAFLVPIELEKGE